MVGKTQGVPEKPYVQLTESLHTPFGIVLVLLSLLLLAACANDVEVVSVAERGGVQFVELRSPAITDNMIDDSSVQLVTVYLPPGYEEGTRSYPVVYFLHGYSFSAAVVQRYAPHLDAYFEEHPDHAFLMVGIDGNSKVGGSHWRDSPVTGGWETFAAEEVPRYIRDTYRVSAEPAHTGIAGFSMGGAAALRIALAHPDRFGAVFANSAAFALQDDPGPYLQEDVSPKRRSAIAAFAHETVISDGTLDEAALQETPVTPEVEELVVRHNSATAVAEAVGALSPEERRSLTVHLEYGAWENPAIVEALQEVSAALGATGLDHDLVEYQGGHALPGPRVRDTLAPFFAEAFGL